MCLTFSTNMCFILQWETLRKGMFDKGKKKLQGRLCQQLLQLLGVVFPATQKGKETTANAGIQPRSMAVIQTAWAFFEHLSQPTIQQFVLGSWASRLLLVDESTIGGIHETIRQVGALCTFVPPHSKSPLKFLRRATAGTVHDALDGA